MCMKKWMLLLIACICFTGTFAQKYQYTFKVNGLQAGEDVYLANYFGDKLYYYDTARSEAGVVKFNRDEIKGGVYAVVLPGTKTFEIILTEEENKVSLETDTVNFVKSMKVIKSEENKLFYDYFAFLARMTEESQKYRGKQDQASRDAMAAIDKKVKEHQRSLAIAHNSKLFGAIIDMSIDPEVPEELVSDTSKRLERYHYYKNHFFDRYHLQDERIVRTPIYAKKLTYFFEKIVIQHPDSIVVQAFKLIDQLPDRTDLFKYTLHTLTYKYETSKIMGMDLVFAQLGARYYCRDEKGTTRAFWLEDQKAEAILKAEKDLVKAKTALDEAKKTGDAKKIEEAEKDVEKKEKKVKETHNNDKVNEICDRAKTLYRLRLGGPAPDLILQDTTEKNWVDIRDIKNEYKILVFWDPGCGHCKKEIPKIKKLYEEIKSRNLDIEVIGVNTELENKDWRKYIRENDLNWINISDNPEVNQNPRKYIVEDKVTTLNSLNFRDIYDIFSTPQIFLIDKNNNIKAKKIGVFNLVEILERELNIDIKYDPPLPEKNENADH